jgi:putative chitinase
MNIAAAIEELCPHGMKFAQALDEAADRYSITSTLRAAHWLGQLAHESGGFARVVENLNYSADGLMRTWPSRFPTKAIADAYARQPEKIANKVYADRIGNGPEASGDGWRFRGRGLIQLTGKTNYHEASLAIYEDNRLLDRPELVEMPEAAALTAGWFWHRKGLNALADKNDTLAITKKVNGGTHGLADRELWVQKFKEAL